MLRVADIDKFWPLVERGGTEVLDRLGPIFSLDDLKAKCRTGEYRLLIDPPRVGFIIIQLKMVPERHLFIWLVWSGEKQHLMKEYETELAEMGRSIGAEYIELTSRRKGLERCGWMISRMDAIGITYRKDL